MVNLKRLSAIAAALALAVPVIAFADDDGDRDDHGNRGRQERYREYDGRSHPAQPVTRPGGRYELRTVQQWVEGRWVEDHVPGSCRDSYRGGHHKDRMTGCTPARTVSRFEEGHYENVQQWVFVPAPRPAPYRYGNSGYRTVPNGQITVNGGEWQASARF